MNLLASARVEELMHLFDSGLSDRAAARAAGVARETAARYRRIWRGAAAEMVVCRLAPEASRRLAEEAARRGISPEALAAKVVAGVADEGYWSAVLD